MLRVISLRGLSDNDKSPWVIQSMSGLDSLKQNLLIDKEAI